MTHCHVALLLTLKGTNEKTHHRMSLATTHKKSIYISSLWKKRVLNQLLPQNNKGLKGPLEHFEFVFYYYNKGLNQLSPLLHTGKEY